MGGDAILADLHEHLGVGDDETTTDSKVSLEHGVRRGLRLRAQYIMVDSKSSTT